MLEEKYIVPVIDLVWKDFQQSDLTKTVKLETAFWIEPAEIGQRNIKECLLMRRIMAEK